MKRIGDYAEGGKLLGTTVYDFDTDRQATLAEWNGNFYTVADETIEIEKIELIKEGFDESDFTLYVNDIDLGTGYNCDFEELAESFPDKDELCLCLRTKLSIGDRLTPQDLRKWYMEEE